jgi:hypothetical protein
MAAPFADRAFVVGRHLGALAAIASTQTVNHRDGSRPQAKIILAFVAKTIISKLAQFRTCLWSRVDR